MLTPGSSDESGNDGQGGAAVEQARRALDEQSRHVNDLGTRTLQREAVVRDERDALDRVTGAQLRVRRAHEAEARLQAADATLAEIEGELSVIDGDLTRCQGELRALESVDLELRRRALVSQVAELSAQETDAHDQRSRGLRRVKRRSRNGGRGGAPVAAAHRAAIARSESGARRGSLSSAPMVPRCWGIAGGVIGFVAARYGASANTAASLVAALVVTIAAALVAALIGNQRKKTSMLRAWQAETDRLESQLETQTAAVLRQSGVRHLDEIEAKRRQLEARRGDAQRLRDEAAGLDRKADALLAVARAVQVQRELRLIVDDLPCMTLTVDVAGGTLRRCMCRSTKTLKVHERPNTPSRALRARRDEQPARCAARAHRERRRRPGDMPVAIDP